MMLKRALLITTLCILGLFFQSSVVHLNFPSFVAPDFVLIVIVLIALNYQGISGLLASFLLGLLADIASGVYLGPHAAGSVVAFCLTVVISKRVFAERAFAVASISFWASLLKTSTYLLLLLFYVSGDLLTKNSLIILFLEALLTAIIAPLVYRIFISISANRTGTARINVSTSMGYTKSKR